MDAENERDNNFYDSSIESSEGDICRVCRMEGTPDKPLHYPCVCTGSIKYIHQDCLVQWLQHSKKEYCELCTHKFTFKPVYAPDMPNRLPLRELFGGLAKNILRALRFWFHYTLVVVAWLGVVPLCAYRIYKCLFEGSVKSLMTLPMDLLSLENIFTDCILGVVVVAISVGGFILLLWLREQIYLHGGPDWLNENVQNAQPFQLEVFIENLFGRNQNRQNRGQDLAEGDMDGNIDEDDDDSDENDDSDDNNDVEFNGNNDFEGRNNLGNNAANENLNNHENNAMDQGAMDVANNLDNIPEANQRGPILGEGEGGWNPDVLMEDLTWEKFLGLDGSFVFLEHVFWIISLNTSFVLVFAFCPYNIGKFPLVSLGFDDKLTNTSFDSVVIVSLGYIVITFALVIAHTLLKYTSFSRIRRTFGLSYIVLKVALLMAIDIGVFPLICGWWLDMCSLPLFALSAKDRKKSFLNAPVTATFLHWLVGMLYVFYFAAFIILLREVLRPGVLWFLRNVNDPQFHPVREMIQLSVPRHSRRFILSLVVFGTTVLVLVWIPVQILKRFTTGLVPFNISLNSDDSISEMLLELLLLQVVLPAFVEQGHARRWLKTFVRHWATSAAYMLGLQSYLIGDVEIKGLDNSRIIHVDNTGKWQRGHPPRGTPLENTLEGVGSPAVRAYYRPPRFFFKMACLTTVIVVTFVVTASSAFVLPVILGRTLLSLFFGNVAVHELYTAAAGLYVIWLFLRLITILKNWFPVGWNSVYEKSKTVVVLTSKLLTATFLLLGIIPFFLGIFFELVLTIPLHVPLNETPLLYIWQDWALGVLHLKIMCAFIMVGPDWWLKDAIDRAYRNGFLNMNLTFIITKIFYPIVTTLLLAMTIPYVITAGILPMTGLDREITILCIRRVYPAMMFTIMLITAVVFQGKQFKALYEKIRNEKYLIGKVLVNYEPSPAPSATNVTED